MNRTKAGQASDSADYNTLTWSERWTRYRSLFLLTSQDVAEAQDSTLPTTSAERVLPTSVIGGNTNFDGKLAKSNLVVIQTVS